MSKGLEALNYLEGRYKMHTNCDDLEVETIAKELLAFEIIKNKYVDVPMFVEIIKTVDRKYACLRYNQETSMEHLTQQEFNLLKEVLKDE